MIGRLKERVLGYRGKRSYSQCGEDIIVDFVLTDLSISNPTYLDVGANQPKKLSNTFLFYERGFTGVCVEPDPYLYEQYKRLRPHDTVLNIGVSTIAEAKADFYVLSSRTLSTFSKYDADSLISQGQQKLLQVLSIPCMTVNQILNDYFKASAPHFLSIDIEGHDLEVLKSYDFSKFRPLVICAETLTYTEDKTERKLTDVIDFVKSQGYFVYADTYINTIFVDQQAWRER